MFCYFSPIIFLGGRVETEEEGKDTVADTKILPAVFLLQPRSSILMIETPIVRNLHRGPQQTRRWPVRIFSFIR